MVRGNVLDSVVDKLCGRSILSDAELVHTECMCMWVAVVIVRGDVGRW